MLANSRTRPASARRALVAVAVPTTMAALLCTATLAGNAFAAGSTGAAPASTPCSTSTGKTGTGAPTTTQPSAGSTTTGSTTTAPGVTPSPSADSSGAHAPSSPVASTTSAAPPAAKSSQSAAPTASPTASASAGGFWGWLNGVWQWIFDGTQQLADGAPRVAAAAPLEGVPLSDSAAGHSAAITKTVTRTATKTGAKTTVRTRTTGKADGAAECATTPAPLKRDDAAAAGLSGAIIPWHLSTPSMTMYGLTFNGVTTIQTANGPEQVLDFTVDKVEIESMVTYSYPGGPDGQRQYNNAGSGTTTVLTDVHLWTTSMTADVYGLIQVTLTPTDTPTQLLSIAQGFTIPIPVVFTDVNADNALMSTGSLSIPGFDGYAGS